MSNEQYSVSITFTSGDYPTKNTTVKYDFSHSMVARKLAGQGIPAAYALAEDVVTVLKMMNSQESFNYTDEDLAAMSPEDQEKAIAEAAAMVVHTVKVRKP